ncbi:uncharacterized protein LOC125586106 [Brassica napus]|uniref:uncharacterized protein LOC106338810 n=1 Tax=Brassica oleracea var. oleracea TaxID=109376 RepID=UPI0006A6E1F4|nr:PREDICTED: uncharacterized protein LOC106338810 [Brassica oleracea var. oleracea]XP_048611874.1 uncharacterized protein LOC125586106 [Brassica napus]
MDERQEFGRLIPRQIVAMLLSIFAIYKGHDLKSDPNRGTKTGRVASEFNTLANICFTLVVARITTTSVVMERIRRTREDCDAHLLLGSVLLLLSLALSAYLRCC